MLVVCVSPPETRNLLLFAIAFSGAAAVGISFTTAWCIRVTSSTTYRYVPFRFAPLSSCLSVPPADGFPLLLFLPFVVV